LGPARWMPRSSRRRPPRPPPLPRSSLLPRPPRLPRFSLLPQPAFAAAPSADAAPTVAAAPGAGATLAPAAVRPTSPAHAPASAGSAASSPEPPRPPSRRLVRPRDATPGARPGAAAMRRRRTLGLGRRSHADAVRADVAAPPPPAALCGCVARRPPGPPRPPRLPWLPWWQRRSPRRRTSRSRAEPAPTTADAALRGRVGGALSPENAPCSTADRARRPPGARWAGRARLPTAGRPPSAAGQPLHWS
jgi:hypothetical protein